VPPPEGEQKCQGACKAGQAQNDNPVSGCYYRIDVAPQSRAQTQVAARIVGNRGVYFTYKELPRSIITAVRMRQDGLARTTLVIRGPVRVDYCKFAADWKIPGIQVEFLQSFAARPRATGFRQAAAQITLNAVITRFPTCGFVEAFR